MKPWWKSKTVWFAFLTGAVASLNAFASGVTDPQALNAIIALVAVANLLLRFVTTQPLGEDN